MKKNSRCRAVRRRLKYGGTLANTRLRSSYELSDTITSGPAHTADWCCPVAIFIIGRLCNSILRRTEARSFRAYLSALQGVLLLALGLLWPRLNLVAMPWRI